MFNQDDFIKFRSIGNIHKYKRKEIILLPETPYRYIYMLCKGTVKVYRLSRKGKETILRILRPYDLFGERALLKDGHSRESVEAMEECELLLVCRIKMIE